MFYGGTFDPVHCGHLAIARGARDALAATIRLMPAADPPHRPPPGADAMHRARMLELAVGGEAGLVVDRRELDRRELQRADDGSAAPSYSVDTLAAVRGEVGERVPLAWLLGADSFRDLPQWHHWRRMFELAHLVIAERAGSPLDSGLPAPLAAAVDGRWAESADALRGAPAGRVLRLRQPLQAGSATGVRARMADGRPWQALLPAAVAAYIQRHRLYGAGGL